MKATFLGTGTSVGVPVIGCDCPVCRSSNPRNKRRRASLYFEAAGTHIVVDTPPDFRDQALAYNIRRVDAVLFTHSHADHIFGFDDIRRFNTIQQSVIPAYASSGTMTDLKRVFDYIVSGEETQGLFRPRIEFREVSGPFDVGAVHVTPLSVIHGAKPTLGYLFESENRRMAYVPDCCEMSDEVVEKLRGVHIMVLDALRHRPHKTHFNINDSVALLKRISAERSYLIHMCHDVDHDETEKLLANEGPIHLSYDGLVVEV